MCDILQRIGRKTKLISSGKTLQKKLQTESRSTDIGRLAVRNQANCYGTQNTYFIADVSLVRSTSFIRAY